MRRAGLHNVAVLRTGDSNPYAYGEWLGAPGKPTVFLYAHHDVQPVNDVGEAMAVRPVDADARATAGSTAAAPPTTRAPSPPSSAPCRAFLKTHGTLPVNVKMLVEGEEEVGSRNLLGFFKEHKKRIQSDVIVVCDTENIETGLPSITYSLRGIVAATVEVQSATDAGPQRHGRRRAGRRGPGAERDPVPALLEERQAADPALLRQGSSADRRGAARHPAPARRRGQVARRTAASCRACASRMEEGVGPNEQTWRQPAVTIIAQEASSIKQRVQPGAAEGVGDRQLPHRAGPGPGGGVRAAQGGPDEGPAVGRAGDGEGRGQAGEVVDDRPDRPGVRGGDGGDAAPASARSRRRSAAAARIGFVGPLADLFGGAPALLLGIEDPRSNAHAPNESLHEGDWKNLMRSLAHLFANLGDLPGGKVK